MKHALPIVVLTALALMLASPLLISPACHSTGVGLSAFEDAPLAEVQATNADMALLARVAARRLISDGKVSPQAVIDCANVLEIAASDPGATGGPTFLTDALKKAHLTDDEILLVMQLAETALRQHFNLGAIESPLGPHTRSLLHSIAVALVEATKITSDEKDA